MAAWSKEVFAKNLRYYMDRKGITQKELAEIVGVSAPTVNEWLKAKKYPRIDKIEILADYFGILKSDLIEEKPVERKEVQKKADTITDVVLRMKTDSEFLELVETLNTLDGEKIRGVKQLLSAFLK